MKTAKVIVLRETEDQSFFTDELLQLFPGNRDMLSLPGVLLYYLMFIRYHRLNDISRRQDCLHDLMLYVTTESTKFTPALQYVSFMYLRKAFIIISDTKSVYNCDIVLETLIESTYLKKVLGRNDCCYEIKILKKHGHLSAIFYCCHEIFIFC